jgi:hypothetical protein
MHTDSTRTGLASGGMAMSNEKMNRSLPQTRVESTQGRGDLHASSMQMQIKTDQKLPRRVEATGICDLSDELARDLRKTQN